MLSIEKTKKLIGDPNVSDEEVRQLRDACYGLSELTFEIYEDKVKDKKLTSKKGSATNIS